MIEKCWKVCVNSNPTIWTLGSFPTIWTLGSFPASNLHIFSFYAENMKEHVLRSRQEEIWDSLDENSKHTYGRDYMDRIYNSIIIGANNYPVDLTPVIRALRSSLLSKRPRERYPCGTGAETLMTVYPILPVWLADKVSNALGIMPRDVHPASLIQWADKWKEVYICTTVYMCFCDSGKMEPGVSDILLWCIASLPSTLSQINCFKIQVIWQQSCESTSRLVPV